MGESLDDYQDHVKTLCGHTVTLPVGMSSDLYAVDCEDCLAERAKRDDVFWPAENNDYDDLIACEYLVEGDIVRVNFSFWEVTHLYEPELEPRRKQYIEVSLRNLGSGDAQVVRSYKAGRFTLVQSHAERGLDVDLPEG